MEIYVEYVIIDNLVIDFLIGFLTLKALRLRQSPLRLIISAAFGTICALLLPLVNLPAAVLFAIRAAVGASMAFIIYRHRSVRRYLLCLVVFLLITFAAGGACFGVLYLTGGEVTATSVLAYQSDIPVGLIAGAVAASAFLLSQLCPTLNKKRDAAAFIRRAELHIAGKTAAFDAFLDTGNRLYDPLTGLPVVLVSRAALINVLFDMTGAILSGGGRGGLRCRRVRVKTVAGSREITVFKPDRLVIYSGGNANIIVDVMIGLSDVPLSGDAVRYECLLHPAVV